MGSISTHWIIEKEGVQTDIHTGDTYLIQETDIGGQILVKQSYTDNLGNFHESSLFSLATPVVAYSNSPANFNISLESGEYSVGETVNISFTVSDADGHQAISQNNYGITWYRHDNQDLNLSDANSYEIINIGDSHSYTVSHDDQLHYISARVNFIDGRGTRG